MMFHSQSLKSTDTFMDAADSRHHSALLKESEIILGFTRKHLKETAPFWKKMIPWSVETEINLYQKDGMTVVREERNSSWSEAYG